MTTAPTSDVFETKTSFTAYVLLFFRQQKPLFFLLFSRPPEIHVPALCPVCISKSDAQTTKILFFVQRTTNTQPTQQEIIKD
jgi:hypothetical protein